ncbi:Gfo/Idh/MocA family protein [Fulvivirga ligni]|uniref:Gfo/Idh/MocA family protein n=1 Tax=Fulvivirga ligni TaxID=2904246 RepID=UPI001F328A5F|nr:Gfo/Idh/MocA family oxidoreductase [Fulvivirga ligni]UII21022.1 Gfo/Idh/MocA family oxidoreductase [Fulvivirga ligni]
MESRRTFIKKSALGTAGLSLAFSASSYNRIIGANDRINFGVAGLHGRGKALGVAISDSPNTAIRYICDVDKRQFADYKGVLASVGSKDKPKEIEDFREMIKNKDIDAVAIATPDHQHAPMAIMALEAGKNVYVEKPCGYDCREGELIVEAQKKYKHLVQMGNQQRSAPTSIECISDIHSGAIGDVYYGKAWYANARGPIGKAKKVPTPDWLNWELWQGPAPRQDFEDIWVHYNWHWNWNWGTGEINNNGTHELDICRWALGVEYPTKASSSGGRYHFHDDWQFYDTQIANFEFGEDKMISWEGKSCNPSKLYGLDRGAAIYGKDGYAILTRNGSTLYSNDGKEMKVMKEEKTSATTNTVGAGALDVYHMTNFLNGIRKGETLNSPIEDGAKSNMLCHLGNMSQKLGKVIHLDGKGKLKEAMQMWGRTYEPGWEPKV